MSEKNITTLPDAHTCEEIEEERSVNVLRAVIANVPDVNIMLNGILLLSSQGPVSVCLGTVNPELIMKTGFQA